MKFRKIAIAILAFALSASLSTQAFAVSSMVQDQENVTEAITHIAQLYESATTNSENLTIVDEVPLELCPIDK